MMTGMEQNAQEQFYKYLSPDTAKVVLGTVRFRWSTPALFNDPLDNQLEVLLHPDEKLMAAQAHDHIMDMITGKKPITGITNPILGLMLAAMRLRLEETGYQFTPEDLAEMMEGALEGERNARAKMPELNAEVRSKLADISIFCMSEVHTDKAMWSYYAASHTGVVLKLVPPHDNSFLTVAQRVNYVSEPTQFTAEDFMNVPRIIRKSLDYLTLTKSKDWAHEKEWRVVSGLRDKTKQFEDIPFDPQELATVYLGCRMSDSDKDEIVGLVRNNFPHVEILQSAPNRADLSLSFHSLP